MRGLADVALGLILVGPTAPLLTTEPRPLRLFLDDREEPVAPELTPTGEAAVREGRRLRERFRGRVGKLAEVVLVADEADADARLEIREAAVHRESGTEHSERRTPKKPAGVQGGAIGERVTDVAVGRIDGRDYALTVRVTAGSSFADFNSNTREPSASSAVDTVIRSLRHWVREHRELLAHGPRPSPWRRSGLTSPRRAWTASAIACASERTSASSGPSAMTRSSGSVPE